MMDAAQRNRDKAKRHRDKNKHPCADCGAPALKASKRCQSCDREWRRVEMSKNPVRLRHGYAKSGQHRPEYYIWTSMIQRCTNPNAQEFAVYGGRGIKVCERWRVFDNFLADMGSRPEGAYESGRAKYTLERKNNDGDYTPKNCVWATYTQQARNRQRARMITYRGKTQPLVVWVEELGLDYKAAHRRLDRGWSVSRVFGGSK
jgi:hypothetical protein